MPDIQIPQEPPWAHEICPECGITWDVPSPDCPKVTFNRHPLVPLPSAQSESAPGPSYVADIVHEAMLRHARNAGAAITALEIIRREAKEARERNVADTMSDFGAALNFIEKFASDVLSQVLPA